MCYEWKPYLNKYMRGVAMHRAEIFINAARRHYLEMLPGERGGEYGLGEDFTLFRSLISSYCEKAALLESEKK